MPQFPDSSAPPPTLTTPAVAPGGWWVSTRRVVGSRMFAWTFVAGLLIGGIPLATAGLTQVEKTEYSSMQDFLNVYQQVRGSYVEPVSDEQLIKGAITGMLAALDPHSAYLDESDFKQLRTQTDGEYGGLGLSVVMEDGIVKVQTPTPNTPAARAGLKSGDYITHLNGKLIYGGTLTEAVEQMRGPPGSEVKLTIVRAGRDKPFDVSMVREKITLKPVNWEVKGQVGYIQITSFSRNTGASVGAAVTGIDKALGHRPLGYVIDLRSNPGGLLDEAVAVSDQFLSQGEIVSQRGRNRQDNEHYYAKPGDAARGLPIVVMIDNGSASAAEIVAGALQDQGRAVVVGQRSFGKGSVQTILPMTDATALRLTTARYYTPSGRSVQEGGIEPDIDVPQLSDPDYKTRLTFREADLRRHLVNETKVDNAVLEDDGKPDPRFAATAESLKAKGVTDFQLDYAVGMIARLSAPQPAAPATSVASR